MRSQGILRALQGMGTVDVAILDEEHRIDEMRALVSEDVSTCDVLPVSSFARNESLVEKALWTFDRKRLYPHGCGVDHETACRIAERSKEYDLVWFWTLRAADMFPLFAWRSSVVDVDDVPSTLQVSKLGVARGPLEYALSYRRMAAWRRREKLLDRRFSVLTVCSEADQQYLGDLGVQAPMHVVPNGYDLPAIECDRKVAAPPRLGFIGVFGHEPNREGIEWFVGKCWPKIKAAVPDVRLRLVGPGSDGPMSPQGPDVDRLGWVTDPSGEMSTWSGMIVPIRIGAGSRVKVAQAVSQKCPLISTRFGAQGYELAHGDGIAIADSAEDFSAACVWTVQNPLDAAKRADRAWKHHVENWTWAAIAPRIEAAVEDCLRSSRTAV